MNTLTLFTIKKRAENCFFCNGTSRRHNFVGHGCVPARVCKQCFSANGGSRSMVQQCIDQRIKSEQLYFFRHRTAGLVSPVAPDRTVD